MLLDASADMFQSNNPYNPTVDGYNDNWSALIDYVSQVLHRYSISTNNNRMGIITYNENANVEIRLDEFTDMNQFSARFRTIRVSSSTRCMRVKYSL